MLVIYMSITLDDRKKNRAALLAGREIFAHPMTFGDAVGQEPTGVSKEAGTTKTLNETHARERGRKPICRRDTSTSEEE